MARKYSAWDFLGVKFWSSDFFGFLFLPPFDHTCHLKSGVLPLGNLLYGFCSDSTQRPIILLITDSNDLHIDTVTLKHCQIILGRETSVVFEFLRVNKTQIFTFMQGFLSGCICKVALT